MSEIIISIAADGGFIILFAQTAQARAVPYGRPCHWAERKRLKEHELKREPCNREVQSPSDVFSMEG